MEAPPYPHCNRKALYTIYGGREPMLRCKKCGKEYSVILVPPSWYRWVMQQLEILMTTRGAP